MATNERIALDTNAVIYFVERVAPYCDWLDGLMPLVGSGRRRLVVSVVTEAESLVKPLRDARLDRIAAMQAFFGVPGIEIVEVTRTLAREAAKVRSQTGLDLPDAIVVATALAAGCDVLVGNDSAFAKRVTQVPYVYLEDAVRG